MAEYRKYLLSKYPNKTYSNFLKLNKNLEKLKSKRNFQVAAATAATVGAEASVRAQEARERARSQENLMLNSQEDVDAML